MPLVAAVAIEVLFGRFFIISGVVSIVHLFRALSSGKCILRLLGGILYLAIGIMFLGSPMQGVLMLILFSGILFMFEGVIKIAVTVQLRSMPKWGWMLASVQGD